jgi:hypothetical protein
MNKKLIIGLLFISVKSFSQEINMKTNIVSALIRVPSISAEIQVFAKGSLTLVYYQGQYDFLGPVNIQGVSILYRQYVTSKKVQIGLKGFHIDLGLNVQKESEPPNSYVNKTLGGNTIFGYQNILIESRIIFDIGIGASWTMEEKSIYQSIVYPRLNISIGYKLKK